MFQHLLPWIRKSSEKPYCFIENHYLLKFVQLFPTENEIVEKSEQEDTF